MTDGQIASLIFVGLGNMVMLLIVVLALAGIRDELRELREERKS